MKPFVETRNLNPYNHSWGCAGLLPNKDDVRLNQGLSGDYLGLVLGGVCVCVYGWG